MSKAILIGESGVTVVDLLKLIANGQSYEQILARYPVLTQVDIMAAAAFCVEMIQQLEPVSDQVVVEGKISVVVHNRKLQTLEQVRQKYPRAYEAWSKEEEKKLLSMFEEGLSFIGIAEKLQRNSGAIISRLRRMNKID